ncbi:MAG: hypothetical protein ABIO94_00465 [Opitutaceae bacterium]
MSKPAPAPSKEKVSQFLNDLLPTAWQKRPNVRFNVYTEMTPEGRQRSAPTTDHPHFYFSPPGTYKEMGWQLNGGEKPPPWQDLQATMQKALRANNYVPIADDRQRPDILIVFAFGSFSTDIALLAVNPPGHPDALGPVIPPPVSAEELLPWLLKRPPDGPLFDLNAIKDVIERARFIGGGRVAEDLRRALHFESTYSGPEEISPVRIMLNGSGGDAMRHVLELAFHTCYFVTATAYDFAGVEKKQNILLWQTRMTVEAQGVEMSEILRPLIVNTGSFLGRETPEAVIVSKRIDREGRVEIGTPTVVEEAKPSAVNDKAGKR